jgi:hypothetical protein
LLACFVFGFSPFFLWILLRGVHAERGCCVLLTVLYSRYLALGLPRHSLALSRGDMDMDTTARVINLIEPCFLTPYSSCPVVALPPLPGVSSR